MRAEGSSRGESRTGADRVGRHRSNPTRSMACLLQFALRGTAASAIVQVRTRAPLAFLLRRRCLASGAAFSRSSPRLHSAAMSEDIGEEGQQSRDGLSAPNSEPGSAAQSPRGDQHDEEDDENGEGEGEEGEGEEGEDGQDESDSEGDENGEDEAQEAQEGQATGEAGERPENTAEPQRQASTAAADQKQAQPAKPAPSKEKRVRHVARKAPPGLTHEREGPRSEVGAQAGADRSSSAVEVGSAYVLACCLCTTSAPHSVQSSRVKPARLNGARRPRC